MYSPALSTRLWTAIGLLSFSLSFSLTATAQPSPVSVARPAYITLNNESTLYIQGGRDYTTPGKASASNQFFSLDLTQPTWDTSKPPWTSISITNGIVPGLATFGHSFSVSPDQHILTIWDPVGLDSVAPNVPGVSGNISLATKTWTPFSVPMKMNQSEGGLQAVTHPRTGLVYTPAGYNNTDMAIYDFKTHTVTSAPLPPQSFGGWRFYTFNWNELRGTFFLWGGQGQPGTPYFYEFDASKVLWTEMITKGVVPPRLRAACMAPAYNGAKMVLFGGNPPGEDSIGTLYILDVPTMTWTQGPSIDPSQNRSQMACTVNGDNFIAWGGIRFTPGSSGRPTLAMSSVPLIYNLYTGAWTTKYIRGSHPYSGTVSPGGNGVGGGEGDGGNGGDGGDGGDGGNRVGEGLKGGAGGTRNLAAIIGSAAAVLVLLLVIAFFLLFRRSRRRRREQEQIQQNQPLPEEFWPSGSGKRTIVLRAAEPQTVVPLTAVPQKKYIPRMETDRYVPSAGGKNKMQLHISPPVNLQKHQHVYGTPSYSNSSTLSSPTDPYRKSPSPTPSFANSTSPTPLWPTHPHQAAAPPYTSSRIPGPIVHTSSSEPSNQQEHYRQLQNQLAACQWELAHLHDKKRLSGDSEYTYTAYTRNPHGDDLVSSTANAHELRQQISSLQAELSRLQAILHL